jgi:glycosyltransferase involved in cell wall biosynthesis
MGLLKYLYQKGYEVVKVPMYLPSNLTFEENIQETPIFFGAINIYLQEKLTLFKHAPAWLNKLFDSQKLLRFIANKTGSTKAAGLEEMTISMLKGEEGQQASHLEELINYLAEEVKPDIVHLSNALLLGLAHRLKTDLKAKVVCSLQDENEWIDLMEASFQEKIWQLMGKKAEDVDRFITASEFYATKSQKQLNIPRGKIEVIYGGIDIEGYQVSPLPFDPPVIGYLCRMSEYFGLGILVDAFINLKQEKSFKDLKLHLSGGYTRDDKKYIKSLLKKISSIGGADDVKIFNQFDKENRISFLKSLTLLSVPVPQGESFGAYQLEALAAGVPVVQPNVGYFPEFVKETKGGLIYEPNDSIHLAKAIKSLLMNRDKITKLATDGRKAVLEKYSVDHMANNVITCYKNVLI